MGLFKKHGITGILEFLNELILALHSFVSKDDEQP